MAGINRGFVLVATVLLFGVMDAMLLDGDQVTGNQLFQHLVNLENKVDSLQERLESGNCGCPSKHTVPAFMASLNTDMHGCAAGQAVIFETTRLNVGNGYDSRHGTFRAPVNGTYFFSATLTAATNGHFHVVLVKNNPSNIIGYLFADGPSNWEVTGTSVVTDLTAGDDVWILCRDTSAIQHGSSSGQNQFHSHFSGFLISQ